MAVLDELLRWWRDGQDAALATVVGTWRSAPRQPGAMMAVGPAGQVVGSVSGGCVEGAVYDLAEQVIATGVPVLARYGVSDDVAGDVGLTCGGTIELFVQPVSRTAVPDLEVAVTAVAEGRPVAVAVLVEHPDRRRVGSRLVVRPDLSGRAEVTGTLGAARLDSAVVTEAAGLLAAGRSGSVEYGHDGQRRGVGARVFVTVHARRPRLIVFGAVDVAAALARVGHFLGYHVTVCDARPVFATPARFPGADDVVVDWPHRYLQREAAGGRIDSRTALAVLTHDPKFDVPLLQVALELPEVGYVGAMGSRRTHEERMRQLRALGLTDDRLDRLCSPIGLDLGARTPEETAISIAAEMIALSWGGGGERLSLGHGPIHAPVPPAAPVSRTCVRVRGEEASWVRATTTPSSPAAPSPVPGPTLARWRPVSDAEQDAGRHRDLDI